MVNLTIVYHQQKRETRVVVSSVPPRNALEDCEARRYLDHRLEDHLELRGHRFVLLTGQERVCK